MPAQCSTWNTTPQGRIALIDRPSRIDAMTLYQDQAEAA